MRVQAAALAAGLGMAGWLLVPAGATGLAGAIRVAQPAAAAAAVQNAAGNPANANPQQSAIRLAGYNAGFRDGVNAYRQQAPYDFQSQPVYQNANQNYSSASGVNEATYAREFRAGYSSGFHDGFYGRSANAQDANAATSGMEAVPGAASESSATPSPTSRAAATTSPDTLPAGSTLHLKLNNAISANSSHAGDQFTATVSAPVYNAQGAILVPEGSTVIGKVQSVRSASGVSGESQIQLGFETLRLPNGSTHPLRAEISQVNTSSGVGGAITGTPSTTNEGGVEQSRTRRTVGTAAAGGAVGALLGALAGGGKGAGIGGIVGAGLGVVLATRNGNLSLAAGTPITIRLDQPVQLH